MGIIWITFFIISESIKRLKIFTSLLIIYLLFPYNLLFLFKMSLYYVSLSGISVIYYFLLKYLEILLCPAYMLKTTVLICFLHERDISLYDCIGYGL